MALQPILNEALGLPDSVKFNIVRRTEHCDIKTARFDGPHIHSCYEIYVNVQGDVSFFHNQKVYDVSPCDVIFSRPGDTHYCIYRSSCLHDHFCLWFEDSSHTLDEYIGRLAIPPAVCLAEAQKEHLMALLTRLADPSADPVFKLAKLIELLSLFGGASPIRSALAVGRPQKVLDILNHIDAHYKEIRTSAELAKAFFISESTLNRLFRSYVGMTVSQIVEARRLSNAEKLLRGGASVTDACFSSGFGDCSRFIALFRNTFGVTPLRYKRSLYKK